MANLPQNAVRHGDYSLAQGAEGLTLIVNGPWNPDMESLVQSGRIHELVLNDARGFTEPDLQFLQSWPISSLFVGVRWMTDLSPIGRLADHLSSLSLNCLIPSAAGTLDLGPFTKLRSLSVPWGVIRNQLGDLETLTKLHVESYSPRDLIPLTAAKSLESLRMKQYPQLRTLEGLESFESLETLGIYGGLKLEDVSALRTNAAQSIRELHLNTCRKVPTFKDVSSVEGVRILDLANSGDFPSLEPLEGMSELQELYLFESTRIVDGDLTPLLTLPKLEKLALANRRNYIPHVAEIKRQLGI